MHLNHNVIQNSFFYKLLVLNCIVVINNKILASASYDYDYNLDSGAVSELLIILIIIEGLLFNYLFCKYNI